MNKATLFSGDGGRGELLRSAPHFAAFTGGLLPDKGNLLDVAGELSVLLPLLPFDSETLPDFALRALKYI